MQFEDDIALGLNAGNEMSSCVRAPCCLLGQCWSCSRCGDQGSRVHVHSEDAELLVLVLETRIIMKSTRAFMVNRLKI